MMVGGESLFDIVSFHDQERGAIRKRPGFVRSFAIELERFPPQIRIYRNYENLRIGLKGVEQSEKRCARRRRRQSVRQFLHDPGTGYDLAGDSSAGFHGTGMQRVTWAEQRQVVGRIGENGPSRHGFLGAP